MKNYYLGLDIGTDSIGYAVTNQDYSLCKFRGNAMWGIRLLEESKTAEERRMFRTARRRTERNKFRQQCLQTLFDKEISKTDVAFFQRLKESNLYEEDKTTGTKFSVFSDADYTDKDYHKDFPTIYHLRKELIENKCPHDARLVYLAVSHIIKNRGHFLFDSDFISGENVLDFYSIWSDLNIYLEDNYGLEFNLDSTEEIEDILKNSSLTKTKKKESLIAFFGLNKKNDAQKIAILTLLTGGTVKPDVLFNNPAYKESETKSICVSSGFDEKSAEYEANFGDDFELIEKIKAVSDWSILANILKSQKYISFAKVKDYEKHKSDLALLKKYVRTYCNDKYDIIFNENKKGISNYLAYSKHVKDPSPEETNCSAEKFCDFLKKTLPKEIMDKSFENMYAEIADYSFMPKMVTKDNSVVPVQITRNELKAILDNASEYLDFLNEKDEKGVSVKDKILSIHSFRIPYYVGPLNSHSDKAWIERKDGKIYPWNFNEIVDVDRSAEKFIENLTSKCTYLPMEDVIPKNSLLYSSFMVLNELNNLRINGEKISVELKQKIYNELFLKRNKVTENAVKKFLDSNGYKDVEISGVDGDFKSNLKPFKDLYAYNLSEEEKEEIIKAITIFGDDKKLLRKRIRAKFGAVLNDEDIKNISNLKYTGWSRLSKKFLTELYGTSKESDTGEAISIIRAMWETNNNLMQLLSNQYTYLDAISEENKNIQFSSLREEVESLYISPKVKRPIYQAMQIVEEIVKIQGCEPEKIFVEVAKGEEEKKRTVSRKARLLELYKSCQKQEKELYEQLQKFDENDFRRDALYLYFTQFGRCMYTGKRIEFEELFNRNIYDIDHIFPKSKIKDDSLDNRVLVCKTNNANKDNDYPIASDVKIKMHDFWNTLLSKGLISKTKYERLTRNSPLTDEELSGFIARQLVETRQSTKAIAQLLEKRYGDKSKIVYVKARLASEFRQNNDMIKSRDVNDLHHAKDAYLNIVVGNVYNTQFTDKFYIKDLQKGTKSVSRLFDYPVKNAWVTEGEKSIDIVKKTMLKNNIRFTRYSYKKKGGLFDQNILKKGNGQVPIKANSPVSDRDRYGAYNDPSATYFALVRYTDSKGKQVQVLVPIDLYMEKEYLENPVEFIRTKSPYIKEKISDVEIIIPCIKYNTLISVNGFRMHISSKSNGGTRCACKPAVQLVLGYDKEKYIKNISNYINKCKEMNKEKEVTQFDKLTKEENIELYDCLSDKLQNSIFNIKLNKVAKDIADNKNKFIELSIYEQCTVLMEILTILHANVRTGDLKLIGGSGQSGALTIGNKIERSKTLNSFKIIHQSITGLYEKEIELLN